MDIIHNIDYSAFDEHTYDLLVTKEEAEVLRQCDLDPKSAKELVSQAIETLPWGQKYILRGYTDIYIENTPVAEGTNPLGLLVTISKPSDQHVRDLVFFVVDKMYPWHITYEPKQPAEEA